MNDIFEIAWLVLLLLFSLGEALTVGLTSIWFAAGALAALVCALLGGPIWLQIGLFLVVSVLCLLAVRPLAKKFINNKVQPTNAVFSARRRRSPKTSTISRAKGR